MAVTSQVPLVRYVAGGGTDFAFPFRVPVASHLTVFVAGAEVVTGYSLTGVGDPAGGTLTFDIAPAPGTRIVLARATPIERTSDYVEGGALRASELDDDFDALTYMVQDIRADAITTTEFQTIADQIEADSATAAAAAATAVSEASDASDSAAAALASQIASAASQASATASQGSAATSASTATTQASSATASASSASTSASTATTQASSATASASTATTQATNASNSATAAAGSASSASSSASAAAASAALAADRVPKTSDTGSAVMPTGSTAQRDGTPLDGYTRFNTTLQSLEVYNSSAAAWVPAGQGATGAVGNPAFYENDKLITGNYTIAATKNAGSFGPMEINTGVTVTVSTGATWTIV